MLDLTQAFNLIFVSVLGALSLAYLVGTIFFIVMPRRVRAMSDIFINIVIGLCSLASAFLLLAILLSDTFSFLFDALEDFNNLIGAWLAILVTAALLGTSLLCFVINIVKIFRCKETKRSLKEKRELEKALEREAKEKAREEARKKERESFEKRSKAEAEQNTIFSYGADRPRMPEYERLNEGDIACTVYIDGIVTDDIELKEQEAAAAQEQLFVIEQAIEDEQFEQEEFVEEIAQEVQEVAKEVAELQEQQPVESLEQSAPLEMAEYAYSTQHEWVEEPIEYGTKTAQSMAEAQELFHSEYDDYRESILSELEPEEEFELNYNGAFNYDNEAQEQQEQQNSTYEELAAKVFAEVREFAQTSYTQDTYTHIPPVIAAKVSNQIEQEQIDVDIEKAINDAVAADAILSAPTNEPIIQKQPKMIAAVKKPSYVPAKQPRKRVSPFADAALSIPKMQTYKRLDGNRYERVKNKKTIELDPITPTQALDINLAVKRPITKKADIPVLDNVGGVSKKQAAVGNAALGVPKKAASTKKAATKKATTKKSTKSTTKKSTSIFSSTAKKSATTRKASGRQIAATTPVATPKKPIAPVGEAAHGLPKAPKTPTPIPTTRSKVKKYLLVDRGSAGELFGQYYNQLQPKQKKRLDSSLSSVKVKET